MKTVYTLLFSVLFGVSALADNPLRHVCDSRTPTGQNSQLASALAELSGPNFDSPAKRKSNKDAFYQAIKRALLATASGPELVACLENSNDSKFAPGFEFNVKDEIGGLYASFDAFTRNAEGKRIKRLELLASENPMAAISFVAHEMKHSCNAAAFAAAEDEHVGDKVLDRIILVDEMRAYKLQATFFLEVARQAPTQVCETTPVASSLFPGRSFTLQNLMAEVDDGITNGTFYRNVIDSYVENHVFTGLDSFISFEVIESKTPGADATVNEHVVPDLISRFESAGFALRH